MASWMDTIDLDLNMDFPETIDDITDVIPEANSASANSTTTTTPVPPAPPVAVKKAEIPFGMIALGALALYLITQKK